MYNNPILDTDSYKFSHFLGYPPEAQYVYSYAESRGGVYDRVMLFGLQKFAIDLADTIVTTDHIQEAADFAKVHGVPFNRAGWNIIVNEHNGRIPVIISAVPEGILLPTSSPLVSVVNADKRLPWLTSYIETALLRAIWYPSTVATRIHYMKQSIKPFFDKSGTNMDFALLDFSARGCTSLEAARLGGMAHLLSFRGSDNIPAIEAAYHYYNEGMAGFSVAATEHSVTTAWGYEREVESIEYLIENMMPEGGVLSMVSDTYNVYDYVKRVAQFEDRIRAKNGTVVIRPDSGDMEEVLPQVLEIMMRSFDSTVNEKGYRVFNHAKLLQGDGINEHTVTIPFEIALDHGLSADSVMTGSGGGLMQANLDRDTCKFAFKASAYCDGNEWFPIRKDPITDSGKRSKAGLVQLDGNGNTVYKDHYDMQNNSHWKVVYDGTNVYTEPFAEIRARLI